MYSRIHIIIVPWTILRHDAILVHPLKELKTLASYPTYPQLPYSLHNPMTTLYATTSVKQFSYLDKLNKHEHESISSRTAKIDSCALRTLGPRPSQSCVQK